MGLLKLQTLFENEGFEVFLGALLKQKANMRLERFFFIERYTGEMEIVFGLDYPFSYNLLDDDAGWTPGSDQDNYLSSYRMDAGVGPRQLSELI
jgi:hypothetical protein